MEPGTTYLQVGELPITEYYGPHMSCTITGYDPDSVVFHRRKTMGRDPGYTLVLDGQLRQRSIRNDRIMVRKA